MLEIIKVSVKDRFLRGFFLFLLFRRFFNNFVTREDISLD